MDKISVDNDEINTKTSNNRNIWPPSYKYYRW